jgi:hypothetical protein
MTATPHDVLRQHGLYELADWAENPAIAPDYAQQSAYWSSVLSAPAMREFAEWPCPVARGFQPEPELPFGVMRAVVLIHRHGKGPYAAGSSVIKAQIRDRRCLSECGHAACTARTNQPPGVDQGSISC